MIIFLAVLVTDYYYLVVPAARVLSPNLLLLKQCSLI